MLALKYKLIIGVIDITVIVIAIFNSFFIKISEMISPICPIRTVTGLLCPVCGGTHAVKYLFQADFLMAVCSNGFVILLGGYLLLVLMLANVFCFSGEGNVKKLLFVMISHKAIIGIGFAAGIFFVINNVVQTVL